MMMTIVIIIAIIIILNIRGKNIWKNKIKSSILTLPVDKITPNILAMTIQKSKIQCIFSENLCISSIEAIILYIVVTAKGEQSTNYVFRDMRNVLSIICKEKVLILMTYAAYGRIYAVVESLKIAGQYDRISLGTFTAVLFAMKHRFDCISSAEYFGNGDVREAL